MQRAFKFFLLLSICLSPFLEMVQDPGGGPDVPINGGLSLLLAAGVGNGVKKYRNKKNLLIPDNKTKDHSFR